MYSDEKYPDELWCTAPKNGSVGARLMPPYQNIWIGSDPRDGIPHDLAVSFDAIVNVSCTPGALFYPARPDQRTYWIPINEMGQWGYASYFAFARIMDFHYAKGHKILVHCHAGAYRSPYMTMSWLVSRGHSANEALNIERNEPEYPYREEKLEDPVAEAERVAKKAEEDRRHRLWQINRLLQDPDNTPVGLAEFYRRMRNSKYDNESLQSLLHYPTNIEVTAEVVGRRRVSRYKHYARYAWYYAVKDWFKRTKEALRDAFGGRYIIRTSDYSRHSYPRERYFSWPWFDARGMKDEEKTALIKYHDDRVRRK